MVAMERQRWSEAVDYLKRLVAVSPRSSVFLKTLAFCALKTGDIHAARDSFDLACLESPCDREALAFLGDCESILGNMDKAEEAWKEALSALDQRTPAGSRAGLALREKLARSAYSRGACGESLAYARDGGRQGQSALLRAYEGLCIVAEGRLREGRSILEEVSASNDEQAAALARSGLEENTR